MKKRLTQIDMVRGISIIVVVAAHTDMPSTLGKVLSLFCIPLFFMVNGYLFSPSRYLYNFSGLVKRRLVNLIVPYFSACLLSYIYWVTASQIGFKEKIIWYEPLLGSLNGNVGQLINFPLWYLTCLFSAQLLFCLTQRVLTRYKCSLSAQVGVYFILGLIGYLISKLVFLPWGLDIAFTVQLFLFIGLKFKEHKVLENMKPISIYTIGIALIFIFTLVIDYNQIVSVATRDYNNLLMFYVGGITGSILILNLVRMVSKYRLIVNTLTFIGSRSLSILIFHVGVSFIFLSYVNRFLFGGIEFNWIINTIGGVLISIILGELLRKHPVSNLLFNGRKESYKKIENKSVELKSYTV
ncbi:acyltransferase family protein [Virgibacillus litoralis]|uniref:Fucose 4-O-acetylase-like acetyltransferase n=1 Tax=Virgibacillus litoralis TaxID=578221 RepID=A0ABS4HDN6_9BACI|nr:acyltransferase family protein [Virgibacillus litoralis]MBP1949031.1 fucose 4-O-acetylase-like acetyltransferase [Virgibacillus litoralis]